LQRLEITRVAASGGFRVVLYSSSVGGVGVCDAVMVEVGTAATDYHPKSSEVFEATATATGNPNVLTASWAVSGIAGENCPVRVRVLPMEANLYGGLNIWNSGLVAISDQGTPAPVLWEAEAMSALPAGAGTFAIVADSTARGGNVRRLVPTSLGTYTLGNFFPPPNYYFVDRVSVWILCKNTGPAYTTSLLVNTLASTQEIAGSVIPSTYTRPTFHFVGTAVVSARDGVASITVNFSPAATGASGMDIDYVAVVGQRISGNNEVVFAPAFPSQDFLNPTHLQIDSAALASPRPLATADLSTFAGVEVPTLGNLYMVQSGLTMTVLPLLNKNNDWLYVKGGVSTDVEDVEVEITRKLAFLTPQ